MGKNSGLLSLHDQIIKPALTSRNALSNTCGCPLKVPSLILLGISNFIWGHPERTSQVRGGEGVSQKGTKGDRRRGGPSKRDVLFTNTDRNQKETNALGIYHACFHKNDHWKSPFKKTF